MPHRKPTQIDRLRGREIAALRKSAGLTQTSLGSLVGLTHQQISKYELGRSSMTLSLYEELISQLRPRRQQSGFEEEQRAMSPNAAQDALARRLRGIVSQLKILTSEVENAIREAERG
jgi:DNA-binding XRE family transcriptional regulator